MMDYYKIFGRASKKQEKNTAKKIAILMSMDKIKDAVDAAEKYKIDSKTFGKIAMQVPSKENTE